MPMQLKVEFHSNVGCFRMDEEAKRSVSSGSDIQEKTAMMLDSSTGFGRLHV